MRGIVSAGLAVVVVLGSVGIADAHKLGKSRAAEANRIYTQAYCDGSRGANDTGVQCRRSHSSPCVRQSKHRVDCESLTVYSDDHECRWLNRWTIRAGSNRLHHRVTDFRCVF
jgi:hypothetical protein